MSNKRRVLRRILTVLVLLAVAGFGAFTTFLFNPLEGSYDYPVAILVPRDVDFFVGKADLADDFDPLPRPAFADRFEASKGGRAILGLSAWRDFLERTGIEQSLEELRASLAQLPVSDPLEVFGGRKLALAGYLRGKDLAEAEWAAYGRVNLLGKLGASLLRHADLLGLSDRGYTVQEGDDWLSIAGPDLPRTLYLTRFQDILVVATSEALIQRAHQLDAVRGEDSFGQSAKYGDQILAEKDEGDELELYVDYRKLARNLELPPTWPDPFSKEFGTAFTGKLLQIANVLDLAGTVDFGTGLELHAFATLSSENMSPVQKRLYRERGFDKARVRDMARLVPADAGLFLMGNGDVGDLLRTALESAEDAMISNLEDQIRSVWGYADYNPLVDDVDAAFKGRFAFCVRDNDYRDEGDAGPPHDDTPVFAWALILLPDDRRKIEEIQTRITNRQADFLIKGREPGSKGVFENRTTGGGRLYEYWSEFIPGTGHLATLELGDFFLISNNNLMLSHMEQTYVDRTNRYAALADVPLFDVNVGTGLASTNLLLWLNPREVHDTMEAFARRLSQMNLAIDWDVERPRLERQVVAEHFPGADPDNLTPDQAQQLEILVEPVLERFEEEQFERQAPALRAEYERRIDAVEILSGGLLELFVDQKRAELLVRLITPFEDVSG